MDPYITTERARELSPLLTVAYPAPAQDAALEDLLVITSVLVGSLTCRSLVTDQPGDAVPDYLLPLAEQAVVLKAEQNNVLGGTARARRKGIRNGNLQSISAGPWSESYFGKDAASKAKMLDLDPSTHEILWALASEECRWKWIQLWTGEVEPAAGVQAFEYGQRPGGYGGSTFPGY